jgi:hypothetical protein
MTPSKLVSIQSQNQSYSWSGCAGPKLICDRQKDDRIGTRALCQPSDLYFDSSASGRSYLYEATEPFP